jgi:hypothetical protein
MNNMEVRLLKEVHRISETYVASEALICGNTE